MIQKVRATQDDSGHWYVIPEELSDSFYKDLENENFVDSGEFDIRYGEYMTGGDLNNIQLYADIKD
jgi:hypothetical protein